MKFKKLILPVVAIVFAIGMAFATTNFTLEPKSAPDVPNDQQATMHVNIGNNWYEIEVDCESGTANCQARFDGDPVSGTTYQVYNSENLNDPAQGSANIKELEGFPPTD